MIHQEQVVISGRDFLHTYSDEYYIRQIETGVVYDEAYDVIPCVYTYEETDEKLPEPPELEQEQIDRDNE